MASRKIVKRHTYKKIIAEALALSMCVTIFQPGGGNSVLAYAAGETGDNVVKWDFDDNTAQGWEVSDWGIKDGPSIGSSTDGRLKFDLDYTQYTTENNKYWVQAGIGQTNLSGVDLKGKDTVSFDFYYKNDAKSKGELTIKASVQTENPEGEWKDVIITDPDSEKGDLKDCVDVTTDSSLPLEELEDGWIKKTVTFKLDEAKMEKTEAKSFVLLVVGRDTDYNGSVYFDNITISKASSQPVDTDINKLYDFEDGTIQGWNVSSWGDKDAIAVSNDLKRLKADIDFSGKAGNGWAESGIEQLQYDGVNFAGANSISFDFYYKDSLKTAGDITIKAVAEAEVNGKDKSIITDDCIAITDNGSLPSEELEDGFIKKTVTFKLEGVTGEDVPAKRMVFLIVGRNTDYKGAVYFDNIKIFKAPEEDKGYVNSSVEVQTNTKVEGTNTALTVNEESKEYAKSVQLADDKADAGTVALYQYLKAIGESSSVIYGHMEDTVLKAGAAELSYSDTEDVTGSIAAIDGLDCGGLFSGFAGKFAERYAEEAETLGIVDDNTTAEDDIKAAAAFSNKSIKAGAIMTLSAHMPNFAYAVKKENAENIEKTYDRFDYSGADSYNLTGDCANNILPGGRFNEAYTSYLDLIAEYASQVEGTILFRPLHENTGSWFWWGSAFCSPETYKSLFKYTVSYLRDEKNVHNFLYLYGPGSEAANEAEYEERYPGDACVDMVGFDSYDNNPFEGDAYTFQKNFKNTIELVDTFAKKHNKLFAVTETGISTDGGKALLPTGNGRKDWYNEILGIVADSGFNCSYFMLWSNYSSSGSYYTPFVVSKDEEKGTLYGHEMLDNFISFYNDKRSIFAADQKEVISGLKDINKPEIAGRELDGYITAPVAGNRILNETEVTAQLNMATDKNIYVQISGNGKDIKLETVKDSAGVYTAVITKADLDMVGETLQGKISLFADNQLLQEISVIFNVKEKELSNDQADDFETYGGLASMLLNKWGTEKGSGCTIDISLVEEPRYEGSHALKFTYNETKDGWAGAKVARETDWSAYNSLRFWVKPDGKNQKTVLQINSSGGSYEAYLNLYDEYKNATTPLLVTLPFSEFKDKSSGAALGGAALKDISSFGLYVNAIGDSPAFANGETMVNGTLYYDDIRAVSSDTDKPVFKETEEKPSEKPEEKPTEKPTEKPAGKPGIVYPPYMATSQPDSATPVPSASQTPAVTPVPGTTDAPSVTQEPGTNEPAPTPAPGTVTDIIKDDTTGAVKEVTTTTAGNTTTVVEKVTMPDGVQNIKESVTEILDDIINIKETLSSSEANSILVKNITKHIEGDVISADAVLYTGSSEINSNYSAKNIIPLSFLTDARDSGISNVKICIGETTVEAVKDNQGRKMVIKIEVPQAEGISAGNVILTKEGIASAKGSGRKLVVKMVNEDASKSYTITIPQSELEKMDSDIDISVNTGEIPEMPGNKKDKVTDILSANGIKAEDAYFVSIAENNTKGGIKVSAPVAAQKLKKGSNVYVYSYNSKTGKLEETANSKRQVLSDGMAGIEGYSGKDYIVTGKELSGKNVVTLISKAKISFSGTSVKKGSKIKINIALPSCLEAKTSLDKNASYGKQAAVIQYKSSGAKVAKVSKDGTVKALNKGKTKITVKIKLADGKVKTVKKNITVK